MVGIIAFTAYCARKRKGTWWNRFGPLIFTIAAALLIMAEPTRHALQDTGVWPEPGSAQYKPHCGESMSCLTTVGIMFTIVCTYTGFICLAIGGLWNANIRKILRKVRMRWRELRAHSASKTVSPEAPAVNDAEEDKAKEAEAGVEKLPPV